MKHEHTKAADEDVKPQSHVTMVVEHKQSHVLHGNDALQQVGHGAVVVYVAREVLLVRKKQRTGSPTMTHTQSFGYN